MGALIVVGDGPEVLNICSGGFLLDAAFSPQRLSELAKMDGAIILAADASRIARANVHLVPEPQRAHVRDRHPPPHRRAGGPLDRRAGHLGVRSAWRSSPSTSATRSTSSSRSPGCSTGPTRRCRRSSATRTGSTRCRSALSALEVEDLVTAARRRQRAAAHRDGAPHRRRDRGLHRRARRRRPARAPAARRADRRASTTSAAWWCATTSTRTDAWHLERGARRPGRPRHRRPARPRAGGRGAPPARRRAGPRRQPVAAGLPAAGPASPACPIAVIERIVDRFGTPPEDHAGHHRRPRRRRRRRRDPGPGDQGGLCPAWPRRASSTATPDGRPHPFWQIFPGLTRERSARKPDG